MQKAAYKRALKIARDDLERLFRQREDLERKIARTRETVISLQLLVEHDPKFSDVTYLPESLTAACQYALVAARAPMDAVDIRRQVERVGFDIKSTNPLASVHSVLKRLVEQKIVRRVYRAHADGKGFVRVPYYWWGDLTKLPKGWIAPTQEQIEANARAGEQNAYEYGVQAYERATRVLAKKARYVKPQPRKAKGAK